MALPQQLKTARASNLTPGNTIDNVLGELEQAVADIIGAPVNTDISATYQDRAKYAQVTASAAIENNGAFNKSYTIPSNSLGVGDVIKIRAFGSYTVSVAGKTFWVRLRIGGIEISEAAGGPGGDGFWQLEAECTVRQAGVSGVIAVGPVWGSISGVGSASNRKLSTMSIDTTVNKVADVYILYWEPTAGNAATMQGFIVEIIRASETS